MTDPTLLAVDIGGTNTRVALCSGVQLRKDTIARFANAEHAGIEDVLRLYMSKHPALPDTVSIALAGPVDGDKGKLTNLEWAFTAQSAAEACGAKRGVLLNDLQAQGHALPFLTSDALTEVQQGAAQPVKHAPALVVNLGTGLNIAAVHHLGGRTLVPAAEAGHISFAAQDGQMRALLDRLATAHGHVAAEEVLSGRGLSNCYAHLGGGALGAAAIMEKAQGGDPRAAQAIALMIRALGEYTGDMALIHLPRGGIYLVGGVARALAPYLASSGFAQSFANKGRFADFLQQFSVHVVHDDYAALLGAASCALEALQNEPH